jgi:hypothetical protein
MTTTSETLAPALFTANLAIGSMAFSLVIFLSRDTNTLSTDRSGRYFFLFSGLESILSPVLMLVALAWWQYDISVLSFVCSVTYTFGVSLILLGFARRGFRL